MESEDLDADEIQCPICGSNSDCEHFLAMFDVTFPDSGKLGAGLIDGKLYECSLIDDLLEQTRQTAIEDYKIEHKLMKSDRNGPSYNWLRGSEGLEYYYNEVRYCVPDAEDIEGADFAYDWSYITNHGYAVMECIRLLLEDDLWRHIFILDADMDERPGCSSHYQYWYEEEPKLTLNKLNKYIESRFSKCNDEVTLTMPTTYRSKMNEPKSPAMQYGEKFHHLPPMWAYRGLDPEELDRLALEAISTGKPVPEWEAFQEGASLWGKPEGASKEINY